MALGIFYLEMKYSQTLLLWQRQWTWNNSMRSTIRTESATKNGIPIIGQRPMEEHIVFQVQEVVAIGYCHWDTMGTVPL